jgi:hypothetical protein
MIPAFACEIDQIGRVVDDKKLCSSMELAPSTYVPGGRTVHGLLTIRESVPAVGLHQGRVACDTSGWDLRRPL